MTTMETVRLIRKVTASDGTVAELKKHGRHDYSLRIVSKPYDHSRWGHLSEILHDEQFFLETGRLPVSKRTW